MLGYSYGGTAQVAAEVGSPWSRYAPDGQPRPPPLGSSSLDNEPCNKCASIRYGHES